MYSIEHCVICSEELRFGPNSNHHGERLVIQPCCGWQLHSGCLQKWVTHVRRPSECPCCTRAYPEDKLARELDNVLVKLGQDHRMYGIPSDSAELWSMLKNMMITNRIFFTEFRLMLSHVIIDPPPDFLALLSSRIENLVERGVFQLNNGKYFYVD